MSDHAQQESDWHNRGRELLRAFKLIRFDHSPLAQAVRVLLEEAIHTRHDIRIDAAIVAARGSVIEEWIKRLETDIAKYAA